MSTAAIPTQKEWANPTAAGLIALAIACFCFFALLTGRVGVSAMPLMGCWLLGGFVVQFLVAIVDLKSGNHAGGNAFLYFSAFFMLTSSIEMFVKYYGVTAGTPFDSSIDGYAWVVLTFATFLLTPAFLKKITLLSIVVLFLDGALPFIALIDLGILSKDFSFIPGWSLLLSGIVAIYLSAATIVNTAYGRTVYPVL